MIPTLVFITTAFSLNAPPSLTQSDAQISGSQRIDSPRRRIDLAECASLSNRVSRLLQRNKLEAAYGEAEKFHEMRPDLLDMYGHVLISTALFTGRYREAESLQAQLLRKRGHETSADYLRLSIASAFQGRVRGEQEEYALKVLRQALQDQGESLDALSVPIAFGTKRTPLLSVLAAGFTSSTTYADQYLEWALRLDPNCPLAADRLIRNYEWADQRSEAARVASLMVKSLPPGAAIDRFAKKVRLHAGKANGKHPIRSSMGGGIP